MKFLMGVLVLTVASAIALVILHFFKTDEPTTPAATPTPAPNPSPAPNPAPPAANPAPAAPAPPPPAPPSEPLWRQVSDEFDKIEREIQIWNPSSTIDVVRTIRVKIVNLVREKGSK